MLRILSVAGIGVLAACSNPYAEQAAYNAGVTAGMLAQQRVDQSKTSAPRAMTRQERRETPATKAWLAENGSWFNHPSYSDLRAAAIRIDDELAREGYRSDEAHYRELENRLLPMLIARLESDLIADPERCTRDPKFCADFLKLRQSYQASR